MIISILSCDNKWGIGKKNGLLFKLPKDMKFFKETTLNHFVALGENTLLSFPNKKPLPNRTHIVLSQDISHNYDNVINVHTFPEFLKRIKDYSRRNVVYIIGGASIYNQTLPYVDYVLLTKVDADGDAEVFFENLDESKNFKCVEESETIIDNGYPIRFTKYKNKKKLKI